MMMSYEFGLERKAEAHSSDNGDGASPAQYSEYNIEGRSRPEIFSKSAPKISSSFIAKRTLI